MPEHFYNCSICGNECNAAETEGYNTPTHAQGKCVVFCCITPLANNPLHYYSHVVVDADPNMIAYQEFSVDIGSKYIMLALNLVNQKTLIKNTKRDNGLSLDFIISPDFPGLHSFIKKIRTVITFS